jgi:DNA-binding XRE family transcriptional regulator
MISFQAPFEAPPSQTPRRRAKERRHDEGTFAHSAPAAQEKRPEPAITFEAGTGAPQFHTAPLHLDLRVDEPCSLKLLRLIDRKNMDDVACYKKANVSRQTWYKIMNEPDYKPNKKTVLSFAVALELTLPETQTLLESVGFVLSQSSLFDVILMFCLSHGIYDVATIDAILFHYDQETLYSKA